MWKFPHHIGDAVKFAAGEKMLVLGATKGLGKAFADLLQSTSSKQNLNLELSSISRNSALAFDFSKTQQWDLIMTEILKISPDRIFYFAGGGPHGNYAQKKWESHVWSYNVNFLFPSFLIHQLSSGRPQGLLNFKQLTLIGSAVAENAPDPGAASYSAGKHGLKGLVSSLQKGKETGFDLRLLSPHYMDTDLIPKGSWPRQQQILYTTREVAEKLVSWAQSENDAFGHYVFKSKKELQNQAPID